MFINIQDDIVNFNLVKTFKKKKNNLELEYLDGKWTYYNYSNDKKVDQVIHYLKQVLNEKII